MASFYLAWFFRCYRATEAGWVISHTPDGGAIMDQDAFFWRAMEIIAETKNLMMIEEMRKGS